MDVDAGPTNRFKHQSYNASLKEVHLPSALSQTEFKHDIRENGSQFYETLEHWKQLNLAPAFLQYANKVGPLSASMPLLLHNWRDVVDLWLSILATSDDEGLRPLLDLLQKLAHDLRTTLFPMYPQLLEALLKLLRRSISAPSLASLLATFSALFKYLLIPSIQLDLLETTWASVTSTLRQCLPEIQRAMSEVWGSVLRRLKAAAREKAIQLVGTHLEGVEDASAWCLAFACKSVSQTLHTSTTSMMAPLFTLYLSTSSPNRLFSLIRRVLTSFIHHIKNSEQFTPLGDHLVGIFKTCVKSAESSSADELERLRRCLELLSIPCAVRQGSRLNEKQLATIANELATNVMVTPHLHRALLKVTSAILIAGDMSVWINDGRKILDKSWTDPSYAMKLHGTLAELNWGGWKSLALPAVLKSTLSLLEKVPADATYFLATLHHEKHLGEVDLVWRQRLDTWINHRLENWDGCEESVLELESFLSLSTYLTSLAPRLTNIISLTLAKPEEEPVSDIASSSRVVGICLQGLAKRNSNEWNEFDLAACTRVCLSRWPRSEWVLSGLEALWSASDLSSSLYLDDVYPQLKPSIMSHSRALRLSALRLLSSCFIQSRPGQQDVLKRCLQGEEVPLDLQGVRERVLRIGRLGQVIKDNDHVTADICIRWLTAQLKVNLRPLWSPAAGALASLSERLGDQVWKVVFEELKSLVNSEDDDTSSVSQDSESEDEDDPWEEERTWRDPSAHKLRGVVYHWSANGRHRTEVLKLIQTSTGRFDRRSYAHQLLTCLSECPRLAEKHNRELVPLFLTFAAGPGASKPSRAMLAAWLALFSKFSNPKALYSTDSLHSIYTVLLSHPDRSLQTLALSCILTYKSPHLLTHEEEIKSLLDPTRWRDALTNLELASLDGPDRSEVVDTIMRLLFGIMLEKKGRTRGADRRAAILSTFASCTDQELQLLIDLMLRPTSANTLIVSPDPKEADSNTMSEKHQLGFLTLLGDVLRNLGSRLVGNWPVLLRETIRITKGAQNRLTSRDDVDDQNEEDEAEEDLEEDEHLDARSPSKNTRSVRQLGLKCLADFFRQPVTFDFTSFIRDAYDSFISPRIDSLDQENIQAPSVLLELFYAWTLKPEYAHFLTSLDARLLPKIYSCLVAKNVKPSVISKVLDIVDRILAMASVDSVISESVVAPHVSLLLDHLAELSGRISGNMTVATPLSQRQVAILSQIAPHCKDSAQASKLFQLFIPFLRRPAKAVPEKVKVDLLNILYNAMPLVPNLADPSDTTHVKTYDVLSFLFQRLRSRPGRLALLRAFQRLASVDTTLQDVAGLLSDLNAYSTKRLEEPDYDRRLTAYGTLNESAHATLSPRHWLPLLYNTLYFIQDPEELAIRSNSSYTLRRFVDRIPGGEIDNEFRATFLRTLYPGLKNGLRSKTEMVRTELLGVLAYAISHCSDISTLQEMQVLLAGGDQEANFFNNIHHVQLHRRSRALRRLAEVCEAGNLRSSTINDIFIPLVGFYVTSTSSVDHHLVNDAILATGRMAGQIAWGAYYALVQKYLKLTGEKDEAERVYVRALVSILENFHFPMEESVDQVIDDAESSGAEDDDDEEVLQRRSATTKVADAVQSRLLPRLLSHLEKRDPTTEDGSRIPVALGIVKVAQHLPKASKEPQVTRLLTILSQILRSRSQETRDLTRDTINRIAITLGPAYLPLIFRELRTALVRGPHLHILAYTAHSLLVRVTSEEHATAFSTLDDCVPDVAHISAEVIFGESGKDVQSEDFKTKMREVRASSAKGLDSFMIMAKYITPPAVSRLLAPLRSIMQETESLKVMNLVDEVLKRIVIGLNANLHLIPSEHLVLCHTLITQNADFLKQVPVKRKSHEKDTAIVQTKRQQAVETDHFARNAHRFVAFGLDLFNTALKRGRFDFKDANIMSRLSGMVIAVGNTLYATESSVLVLGLKCVAGLVRCPSKTLEESLPVFIRQILDIVKRAGSTEPEIVQVAFKSMATVLRDGPTVHIQEKDLVFLLELLTPDLEEPERQASVFAMLRAIVARKFVVPEIYDAMDKVSEIMVTSQSPQVQELCRSLLLQFLLDYPQGKGRLRNQMVFLTKNLSYVYESGRKSVMELLSALITKFDERLVVEYADLLFVALVMVIANDDSAKCREMAAQLIKNLVLRLDEDRRTVMMSHLHAWASQRNQMQLVRVSLQVYGIVADTLQTGIEPQLQVIHADVGNALEYSSKQVQVIEEESEMDVDLDWQVPYYSLVLLEKILRIFPQHTSEADRVPWATIVSLLLFPHAWVRTASCRLLGMLFNTVPVQPPSPRLPADAISVFSISGSKDAAEKMSLQLKSEHLDEALSLQIVKNLFYLGKCFAAMPLGEVTDSDAEEAPAAGSSPLPWLFSRLSYQIKSAHIARRNKSTAHDNWTQQPLAILKWFAAMSSYLDSATLERFLVHMLTPLNRIQDEDTLRDEKMDELKIVASELQDLVQQKVGVTKFSAVYQQIRQGTLDVRRERKATRAVQIAVNPELSSRRKTQRNSLKKESKKRKTQSFSERKGKMKRRRED